MSNKLWLPQVLEQEIWHMACNAHICVYITRPEDSLPELPRKQIVKFRLRAPMTLRAFAASAMPGLFDPAGIPADAVLYPTYKRYWLRGMLSTIDDTSPHLGHHLSIASYSKK